MVQNNKEQLLSDILYEYGSMVSALCTRMIQDTSLAEDASQEVWFEIVKSIDTFEGKSKLSTWIYKICYRVINKMAQKEKVYSTQRLSSYFRDGELSIPENIDYDHRIWIKEMCNKCLTGILHCLNNETRLIYLLRDIALLEYEDIAIIMDKEEASVRKILSRGRKKLKNFLNDECVLYNPHGNCKCRMKKLVVDIKLDEKFTKLRELSKSAKFYLNSEKLLPQKNYWEKFI